ncbi:MAG: plastocyanin/azurin family copper-binding protein [Chloroflexi bacterium]|nr:plastocyanin/azurin family copper-binding protein [Chloroflexota bacterium]
MAHQTEHTTNHPTFMQYVLIAIVLFAITIVEFVLIWDRAGIVDHLGASKIPLLVGLSAVKFAIVIMYYMHLKFDNRLFGTVFIAGLALAFIVGIALLSLFVAFEGGQRDFAEANAIPYVEHGEEAGGESPDDPPVAAGPVAIAINAVGDAFAFSSTSLSVNSGDEVTVTFDNPSATNSHNFVVVQNGTKDAVAGDGAAAGPGGNWVPAGDSRVIANTVVVAPGGSEQVIFTAPAPGTYQFVCTFPGHNFAMFGDFIVH